MLVDIWVIVGIILAFIGGFVGRGLYNVAVQKEAIRQSNAKASVKGIEAKQDKADQMSLAIAEAATMMEAGKKPMEIIPVIAKKYPSVAFDLAKKAMKGDILGQIDDVLE